jgi:hypothetical protein
MCNVWLSIDHTTARAYATTAFQVPTETGTAVLFSDGSAGYVTTCGGWRYLLTRARRDEMLNSLYKKIERMERNIFTRLFSLHRRADLLTYIRILERTL